MPLLDDYITDVLMRDLVGHDHKPVSFLVYLWLAAEQARTKREIRVSYQQVAESVGISKSSVQSAIRWLLRRKLLTVEKETVTATPVYTVRTPWRETSRHPQSRQPPRTKNTHRKKMRPRMTKKTNCDWCYCCCSAA